jgi:NAD(P)-dependent dehydrogenase (short-subunit alcohol dehydrogenase family)
VLLKDKIVIVSGIGPGLGVKLAIEAAREGAAGVVAAARSADKLDDAEKRVRAVNPNCKVLKIVTDITDRAQCDALVAATIKQFGRIDALVNSAFIHGEMDYVATAKLDDWAAVLGTNLIGTLKLTQAVLPQMQEQFKKTGVGGAIVMINTMAARQVPPLGEAGYAASKSALANSAKYLAKEVGKDNIRVNSIHMGWMWGAPVQGYMEWQASEHKVPMETLKAQVAASIPLGRIPTDDECARAALFLVSDYASAVTGAALDANGGAYMP